MYWQFIGEIPKGEFRLIILQNAKFEANQREGRICPKHIWVLRSPLRGVVNLVVAI